MLMLGQVTANEQKTCIKFNSLALFQFLGFTETNLVMSDFVFYDSAMHVLL